MPANPVLDSWQVYLVATMPLFTNAERQARGNRLRENPRRIGVLKGHSFHPGRKSMEGDVGADGSRALSNPKEPAVPSASTTLAPGTHHCNRDSGEDIPDAGNAPKVFAPPSASVSETVEAESAGIVNHSVAAFSAGIVAGRDARPNMIPVSTSTGRRSRR